MTLVRQTLTLNLIPREMEVVEQLAEEADISKTAIIRQALRLYQLVHRRIKQGETLSFSGDKDRQILFVGLGLDGPDKTSGNKFRKKPIVVEATQWFKNGDHPLDYPETMKRFEQGAFVHVSGDYAKAHGWDGDLVKRFMSFSHSRYPHPRMQCSECKKTMGEHGRLCTLEGDQFVCPGDWIITGIKGEHYPCKPDIFVATYEPAE